MQGDLRVILVDDDDELCRAFVRCFELTDGVELISVTNNAAQALDYVRELGPDAVILDLELHRGSGNGIQFLNQLNGMTDVRRPYILICTNNSSRVTYDAVGRLGADFVMYKHQEGFSPSEVADFLLAVGRGWREGAADGANPGQNGGVLRNMILDEMNKVAINPKCKGYLYLADAIEIFCDGQVPNVSAVIGEKYGKTEASVERAMQNAINRAWNTADINDLLKYYTAYISPKRNAPTVTEFICYYAGMLRKK